MKRRFRKEEVLAKDSGEPHGEGTTGKPFASRIGGLGGTKGRRRGAPAPKIIQKAVHHPIKPSTWRMLKMLFNLGAFLAGASAGYFFSKAENQFTRYGKRMMSTLLRNVGGEDGETIERGDRFSDRRGPRVGDPDVDPMGEFSEDTLREDDP